MKRYTLLLAFACVFILNTGMDLFLRNVCAQTGQPTAVRAVQVQTDELQERQQVTGSLRAARRAQVAAMEEGKVLEISVDEADPVQKDQILARIDDRRLQAQMAALQAEKRMTQADIEAQQAELKNAQWNVERYRNLWERQMTTEQNVQSAETEVNVAEARLSSLEKSLERVNSNIELLEIRLSDMIVRAPFDGHVIEKLVEIGEWINPGDPVATVISTGEIEAWLEVPERYSFQLPEEIRNVEIQLTESQDSIPASSVKVVPTVDPRVRTFYLIANLQGDGLMLKPGMAVTAWLPTGEIKPYMTIPGDAIMRAGTGPYVFKAQKTPEGGYVAVSTPVNILFRSQGKAVIESTGLTTGEYVITEGNERLQPMMPVTFTQN